MPATVVGTDVTRVGRYLLAMASGMDPNLTALAEMLQRKFPWLNPQFGFHAGQKPDQTVRVELGDGLIIVFSVDQDTWTANAIVFDGQKPLFNDVVTERVQIMEFMWVVNRIRTTYKDVAEMLRADDPDTSDRLERQLDQLNAALLRPRT